MSRLLDVLHAPVRTVGRWADSRTNAGPPTGRELVDQTEVEIIGEVETFTAMEIEWNQFVQRVQNPSPFQLHGWLLEQALQGDDRLVVVVCRREGKLVGALPLRVRSRRLRQGSFLAGRYFGLDLLLAEGEPLSSARGVLAALREASIDYLEITGLRADSVLARALSGEARLIRLDGAPVARLPNGWAQAYESHTNSKTRNLHRRRLRQLSELGRVDTVIARTSTDLGPALESAFDLHELRWATRSDQDGSGFATPDGKAFHRAALARLAALDVARIALIHLDDRPIAFVYYFCFRDSMFVHRLAFDPQYERFSPGLLLMLQSSQAASDEGAQAIEFLRGEERYKLQFADEVQPLLWTACAAQTRRGAIAVWTWRVMYGTKDQLRAFPVVFDALKKLKGVRSPQSAPLTREGDQR